MLKIGQVRKVQGTDGRYLTDLSIVPTTVKTRGYEDSSGQDDSTKIFDDFALALEDNGDFVIGQSYYLRVTLKRIPDQTYPIDWGNANVVNFSLVLYQSDGGDDGKRASEKIQTVEKNVGLGPYIVDHNTEWQTFTFVITPNANYKYLCFKINRIGYDYVSAEPRNPFIYGTTVKRFDSDDGDACIINNILPRNSDKIGIQSRPGTLFCVNQEPIILGRSGIYEINNGTRITNVGVVAPNGSNTNNIQDFILDYAWDTALQDE